MEGCGYIVDEKYQKLIAEVVSWGLESENQMTSIRQRDNLTWETVPQEAKPKQKKKVAHTASWKGSGPVSMFPQKVAYMPESEITKAEIIIKKKKKTIRRRKTMESYTMPEPPTIVSL